MLETLVRKISAPRLIESRLLMPPGPSAPDLSVAFDEYARHWLMQRIREGLKSGRDYASMLAHHLVPAFGSRPLHEIRRPEVRAWVGFMRERKDSANSILNRYGLLRNIFADAERDELILRSPCTLRKTELPKKEHKQGSRFRELALFSAHELEMICAFGFLFYSNPIERWRRVLYALAFCTGARLGELLALRWRNIDFDAKPLGAIVISESYSTKRHEFGSTKTGAMRDVAIVDRLVPALLWWKYAGFRERAHREPTPEDPVFPRFRRDNCSLEPESATTVYRRFQADLDRLGLRRRRFHDMRRTFVTIATNSEGVDKEIIRWVTHAPPGDVHSGYRSVPHAVIAREMAKIKWTSESHQESEYNHRSLGTTED